MLRLPSVTVVVPTFREADNIPTLLERIDRVRRDHDLDLDVLIMDDDSRDGSVEAVAAFGADWVQIVTRTSDRGLSPAVTEGLYRATRDVVLVMDADLSHPPEKIPEIVAAIHEGADFAIGSRYVEGGSTDDDWGLLRWLNSRIATLLALPLTSARDPMAGFFALRRERLDGAELNAIGYKIGLEVIVKCDLRKIEEVPIHFTDRVKGDSKLTLKQQLLYVQHLERLYIHKLRHLSDFGQFAAVGASGVVVNLAVLMALTAFNVSAWTAVAAAIFASVVSNFALGRIFPSAPPQPGSVLAAFASFVASTSIGAVTNYVVTLALLQRSNASLEFAAVAGVAGGLVFNLVANRFRVFKLRHYRPKAPRSNESDAHAASSTAQVWLGVGLITLFGLLLRCYRLGNVPFWRDEYTTYFFATEPLSKIFSSAYQSETNPPLFYLLEKLWLALGTDESALRMLPVVFGTACIPALFQLTRSLLGNTVGLVACSFLATAPLHIEHSRSIRTYSLLSLSTLVGASLLLQLLQSHGLSLRGAVGKIATLKQRVLLAVAYVFTGVLMLYMHNTAVFFPMLSSAFVVGLVVTKKLPVRVLIMWTLANLAIVALAAPWLRIVAQQNETIMTGFWIPKLTASWVYSQTAALHPVSKLIKPLFFALIVWGCWRLRKQHGVTLLFSACYFVGLPLLLLLASLDKPIFINRAMLWGMVFSYIPLAFALVELGARWRAIGASLVVVAAQLAALRELYPESIERDQVHDFVPALAGFRKGDTLLVAPEPFAWNVWYETRHLDLERKGFGVSFSDAPAQISEWLGVTHVRRADVVSKIAGDRVWLLIETEPTFEPAPGEGFEQMVRDLEQWGTRRQVWRSGPLDLALFEKR